MTDNDAAARAAMVRQFLAWRGVLDPCPTCHGSGVVVYASTATWRGGMGGAAMTHDVCDGCWGTGDAHRKGTDLRALRDAEEARVAKRAGELLAWSVGANLSVCHAAIGELAAELERIARGRKPRTRPYYDLAASLAKTLRAMVPPPAAPAGGAS